MPTPTRIAQHKPAHPVAPRTGPVYQDGYATSTPGPGITNAVQPQAAKPGTKPESY